MVSNHMRARVALIFICFALFGGRHVFAEERKTFGIAANFLAAEPFPSMLGIMAQGDLDTWLRFSAGYGFTKRGNSSGSSVGFAISALPLSNEKNGVIYSLLTGLSFARIDMSEVSHFGITGSNKIVTALDIGGEFRVPHSFMGDIGVGMGTMIPFEKFHGLPIYVRLMYRFW